MPRDAFALIFACEGPMPLLGLMATRTDCALGNSPGFVTACRCRDAALPALAQPFAASVCMLPHASAPLLRVGVRVERAVLDFTPLSELACACIGACVHSSVRAHADNTRCDHARVLAGVGGGEIYGRVRTLPHVQD